MALGTDYAQQDCSLARALEVLGERWSLLIVRDAFYGVRRFNDFLTHLDIPRAVLTARLASLTGAGVLRKVPYQDAPVRYDYVLTAAGKELWPAVHGLARWGERHATSAGAARTFHHAACGTRLDPAGTCPRCRQAPAIEDIEMRPGPGHKRATRDDTVARELRRPHRLLQPVGAAAAAQA